MRVPLEWLREFVDLADVPVDALVDRLPGVGLGVEAVERVGDDTVLELEVTPNRPDCLSILGVAREVALLLGRPLRAPGDAGARGLRRLTRGVEHSAAAGARLGAAQRVAVRIEDPGGCPRFVASVIEGIWIGASPSWMQRRLEAAGVRPINNVVDVTNYVMLELGQPMHAFDYERVSDHALTVRRARPGEALETLDGAVRALDETMLVVADEERAISLAGILGGRSTEITPDTTTVLLEAAHWDPPTIGRTARRLGIRTEASARFERGTEPEAPPQAQARAAELLTTLYGARVLRGMVDVYPRRIAPRVIRLRPERAASVLGIELPRDEIARILRALGCTAEGARALTVRVPTHRPDLTLEEDLIEEIARIYGYDRVPLTLPRGDTTPGITSPSLVADREVRETLARCGLVEALTLTLTRPETAAEAGGRPALLRNPLTRDHAALRTSLLPGLIEVLATNAARHRERADLRARPHLPEPGPGGPARGAPVARDRGDGAMARGLERPGGAGARRSVPRAMDPRCAAREPGDGRAAGRPACDAAAVVASRARGRGLHRRARGRAVRRVAPGLRAAPPVAAPRLPRRRGPRGAVPDLRRPGARGPGVAGRRAGGAGGRGAADRPGGDLRRAAAFPRRGTRSRGGRARGPPGGAGRGDHPRLRRPAARGGGAVRRLHRTPGAPRPPQPGLPATAPRAGSDARGRGGRGNRGECPKCPTDARRRPTARLVCVA